MTEPQHDRVRGFPAFGVAKRGRGQFARSWWGKAWIKAMEDTALDQQPLKQGRRYAYAGRVGTITASPGRLAAVVDGEGEPDGPYRTVVYIPPLTDDEWAQFLDRVASRAGHVAALLDRDMPHDLVETAEDAGIPLLPVMGDLEPECDCPDWELPCRHAAALCYQASWLLDADPFVLLLLRGRGEAELLGELQLRNVPRAEPATARVEPDAIAVLVANAADRARRLLSDPSAPQLDLWQDSLRMAATQQDLHVRARLKASRGDGKPEFEVALEAWSYGGTGGLATLESAWSPPATAMTRARTAWCEAWEGEEDTPVLEFSQNRCTVAAHGLQLRLGRDGYWYPFREQGGDWWPAGPPDRDPAVVFARQLD